MIITLLLEIFSLLSHSSNINQFSYPPIPQSKVSFHIVAFQDYSIPTVTIPFLSEAIF